MESWLQRLLKRRGRRDEPSPRLLSSSSPEDTETRVVHPQCPESIEAPPGTSPCVSCYFRHPRHFAGIINAALEVSEYNTCGMDGKVPGVYSDGRQSYHRHCRRRRDVTAIPPISPPPPPATSTKLKSPGVAKTSDSDNVESDPAPARSRHHVQSYQTAMVTPSTLQISNLSLGASSRGYFLEPVPTSGLFGGSLSGSAFKPFQPRAVTDIAGASEIIPSAETTRTTVVAEARRQSSATKDVSKLANHPPPATFTETMGCQVESSQADLFKEASNLQGPILSLTSSPPPPATISAHPVRTFSSRRHHNHGSLTTPFDGRRQTQSQAFSDKDGIVLRETITTTASRSSHLQSYRFITAGSSARETEPPAGILWSCGRRNQTSGDFRLPGEPWQSAARRWCDKFLNKRHCAAFCEADSESGSSMKKRRVDGDNAEPLVVNKLPEKTSSVTALNSPRASSHGSAQSLQPANAAVGAMTTQKRRICFCGGSQPTFGLPGEPSSSARWCSNCPDKPSRAVNTKNKRCLCGRSQPSFGLAGGNPAVSRWCSKCPDKPANAVDVKHKRCMCSTSIPNFGLPGEPATAARWCSKCPDKPSNAVDVKNKRCQCGRSQPSLGLPGEAPAAARWCSKCPQKPPSAVGVKSKRCKCGISQPSFGLLGERATLARWCCKCPDKPSNAVNLKSKKCRCGSSVPSFGLPGEPPSVARWCSKCPDKSPNAVDVKNKKYKRRCA